MQQKFQSLWRDLKDFCLCSLYFRKTYPSSILPKIRYVKKIDIDQLLSNQNIIILRRSEISIDETYNKSGNINEKAIPLRQINDLSLNILGTKFKLEFFKYSPINKTNAVKEWTGEKIYLSDHFGNYKIIEGKCAILWNSSEVYNKNVKRPYVNPKNKELKNILQAFNREFIEDNGNLKGTYSATLTFDHFPTNLNYWHGQLQIISDQDNTIEKIKNHYEKEIADQILRDILCVKFIPLDKYTPVAIGKEYYYK